MLKFLCSYLGSTCIVFANTNTGVADVSKGNHEVRIMSWLNTMRTADWTMWNNIAKFTKFLVWVWIIGMNPAFVKCPVSGSLVGSSSRVKESVRLSKCSMSRLR